MELHSPFSGVLLSSRKCFHLDLHYVFGLPVGGCYPNAASARAVCITQSNTLLMYLLTYSEACLRRVVTQSLVPTLL